MLVNFNQNNTPSFQANVMNTSTEVVRYLTGIVKSGDIADLKATIKLTQDAGKDVFVRELRMGAEDLGLKLD